MKQQRPHILATHEERSGQRRLSRRKFLGGAGAAALVGATAIAPKRVAAQDDLGWDAETDVLVVGLGAAGASAAIAARSAGAAVLALEAAPIPGGTSRLSAGEIYLGGGTPLQRRLGFDDSSEEMIKYLIAASGAGADEEKIRLYCEGSLDHYAWLLLQGVEFKNEFYPEHHDSPGDQGLRWAASEPCHPFSEISRPAPRSHKMRHPGMAGAALMDVLVARCKKTGVPIQTSTRCEALITAGAEGEARVLGVVARGPQGERRIRARGGVVLATGGFISNPEMLRLYAPMLLGTSPLGAGGDDGSGILMGIGLGAAALHMDAGFVGLALHPPEEIISGVLVDPRGQRFINEDAYLGRVGEYARWRADGDVMLILDASVSGSPALGENELVAKSESAQGLQQVLGRPALSRTLAAYNEYARVGEDPLFGKQAQFLRPLEKAPLRAYHYKLGESFWPAFTLGGLRTRPTGEVQRPGGDVIPGLYAAGRASSGVPARAYNTGTSLGDATFFGRRAGQSAALGFSGRATGVTSPSSSTR